jgi:hypothetical protein
MRFKATRRIKALNVVRLFRYSAILMFAMWAAHSRAADGSNVIQVDWNTRTASCPAKITQSTSATIRVTNINDLLIDFNTGDVAQYQVRAKGSPVSVVPPENPFTPQITRGGGACDDSTLVEHLDAARRVKDPRITPPQAGGPYISWSETAAAAHNLPAVAQIEADLGNTTQQCKDFFSARAADPVVQWIKRLDATPGSTTSGAPPHSVDFNVNLEPNLNYEFVLQASWRGKTIQDGTLRWNCGENDILTLSVGPLITTLPYRTYNQQQVPNGAGGTQNELVISGTTNVNVLGAALLNYHLPSIPGVPAWTGLAFSIGPVYTLGNAPSVSKLGLFVGGSVHLYRSLFLTPGIHIGEFADFPAGFHQGSVIPSGFGNLTPVTRNTARFAIGITFKTTSLKKSSPNNGAATNTATTGGTSKQQPNAQSASGSQGQAGRPTKPPTQGSPEQPSPSGRQSPTPPTSDPQPH